MRAFRPVAKYSAAWYNGRMLRIIDKNEFDGYVDRAYALTQDFASASYPLFNDGIKTKDDFVCGTGFAFVGDDEKMLAFERGGEVRGFIQYMYDGETNGVSTYLCPCDGCYFEMLTEFIRFVGERYGAASVALGFPEENKSAVQAVKALGFALEEESVNTVLDVVGREFAPPLESVRAINGGDFAEFGRLHDKEADGMYWTADRIARAADKWSVYGYYDGGKLIGAAYALDEGSLREIFGIDFDGERNADIAAELIRALACDARNAGKGHIVYFCDDEEFESTAKPLGFRRVGKYLYFVRRGA